MRYLLHWGLHFRLATYVLRYNSFAMRFGYRIEKDIQEQVALVKTAARLARSTALFSILLNGWFAATQKQVTLHQTHPYMGICQKGTNVNELRFGGVMCLHATQGIEHRINALDHCVYCCMRMWSRMPCWACCPSASRTPPAST